jgi:GTP-binding protein HflX
MADENKYIENINEDVRKAVLCGARKQIQSEDEFIVSMDELSGLAEALDIEPVSEVVQNIDKENGATYIGKGKVEELREEIIKNEADLCIFNNALSPAQLNNLSNELECEVLDRTGLILNIFTERAKTKEAKLQTDYAHLKYMLPRLVGLRSNLGRQGGAGSSGGSGSSFSNKGSGEKKIELDRRKIQKEMASLKKQLEEVEINREQQRKKRSQSGLPLIALVGYTNAGKSSLMNKLLKEFGTDDEKEVFTKDMLFATLDTSVRKIEPSGSRPFLLSDTVGFINNLPTDLVKAFRATLEEALYADLIIDVVDYSDPDYKMHMEVTKKTLNDLGAGDIRIIHVMNKADKVAIEIPSISENTIVLSVKTGQGIDELLKMIEKELSNGKKQVSLLIPYSDSGIESELRDKAIIKELSYENEGIKISAEVDEETEGRLKKYITN